MTRILIVDDKTENLYYLHALFTASGYEVEQARHGAEALIVARSRRPDLVVSDLLMPVMDGYTLLRYWKADVSLRAVPFVVYTATYTEEKDAKLALDLGADAFVLKPAEPDVLLENVRAVLAAGAKAVRSRAIDGDSEQMMQVYSETLIRKLEEKSLQLEDANRRLGRTASLLEMAGRVARVGGWWVDVGASHVVWSDEVCRMHGEPPGTAPTLETAFGYFDERSRPEVVRVFNACIQEGTPYDAQVLLTRRDGQVLTVRVLGEAVRNDVGAIVRVQGAIQDVTEAHRAELERAGLATRLKETLESISDAVLILDAEWHVTYVNPECERLLQHTREQMVGKNIWQVFPEAVGSNFETQYRLAATERRSVHFEEYFAPLTKWFDVTAYPTAFGIAIYFRDVTARRETARRISQQAALLDKAQDAIIVRSLDEKIIYWNKSAERLYGYTAEEAVGGHPHMLINDNSAEWEEARQALLTRGEWFGTLRQVTRDGRRVICECRWTLVHDDAGKPESILAINTDITDRRSLEQQFLRAQRLESIGTLAGGIAHDLNNILSPVMMSLELLQELSGPPGEELIQNLQQNVRRGADLVRQVLTFARGLDGVSEPVDVRSVVREIEIVIRDTFPKSINLLTQIDRGACVVLGDATQLHQVVMNLAVNARDAMPNGGTLRIGVERREVTEREGTSLGVEAGSFIALSVSDDGEGIEAAHQQIIFEPFFTTKDVGRGTGLGLSTVQSIVKGMGGTIQLASDVGKGTTFTCLIPEAQAMVEHPSAPVPQRHLPRGDGELILVVDDEEAIRVVADRILTRYGYRVVVAANGVEGLKMYDEHHATLAAIITDVSMPEMDGPAMIAALRARKVEIPIIVSSGYIPDEGAGRLLDTGTEFFISKPFSADGLLSTLRGVLVGRD